MTLVDGHTTAVKLLFPALLGHSELFFEFLLLVTIAGGTLKVLGLNGLEFVGLGFGNAFLQVFNLLGSVYLSDMYARSGLVHRIDGLVGEETVADVAVGQGDTGLQGLVGIIHTVVLLIHLLDVVQDLEGLLGSGWLDKDLLEAALQGTVLLDALAVLVEGGGTDALELTTRQGGLQQVGGIHRPAGITSAHNVVDLVDKHDDVLVGAHLVDNGLETLLKLATVFGACHEGGEVERDDPFVVKGARHTALDDAQC